MSQVRVINNHDNHKSAIIRHDGTQYVVSRVQDYKSPSPKWFGTSWKEASFIADLFVNSPE